MLCATIKFSPKSSMNSLLNVCGLRETVARHKYCARLNCGDACFYSVLLESQEAKNAVGNLIGGRIWP